MVFLVVLLALAGCNCCSLVPNPSAAHVGLRYYRARVVRVVTDRGYGSGVSYRPGLILTAYHVVVGRSEISIETWRDGHRLSHAPGKVVFFDRGLDLAMVRTKAIFGPSTPIARRILLGARVVAVGYPYDRFVRHGKRLLVTRGEVAGIWPLRVRFTAAIYFGCSGGGVFDRYGRLVTLAQWGMQPFPAFYGTSKLWDFVEAWRARGAR